MVKKHKSAKEDVSKAESKKETSSSKLSFDTTLLKKAFPVLITVILLGFVMWFAFHIRSGPINLDGLEDNVRTNVHAQIQSIISQEIDQKYPSLNPAYKQEMVQKEYQKVLDTGIFEIQGQQIVVEDIVKQNAAALKQDFQFDENGQTYLTEMDSHHWFHLSRNYFEHGHTGDALVNNEPWLTTKVAPVGFKGTYEPEFQIWAEAKLYEINGLSKTNSTDAERTKAIYLLPVILVMLSAIPAYFLIRRFSNDLFAFFGSLVLVSIGTYVSRTMAGFVDTDAYNILFPLLIVLLIVYAFTTQNKYLKIFYSLLAGISFGLFLWAWAAGWFLFIFLIITLVGYLGYVVVTHFTIKENNKSFFSKIQNDLMILFVFLVSTYLFVYLFIKQNIFVFAYEGMVASVSTIAGISTDIIWPNVLSSVAELNPASFPQIVGSIGGNIIFVIAMLGILFLSLDYEAKNEKWSLFNKLLIFFSIIWFIAIVNANLFVNLISNYPKLFVILLFLPIGIAFITTLFNKLEESKVFLTILFSVWIAGTIYMCFSGVRFIILLAPAFCVAFGIGLYYIAKIINKFVNKEFDVKHPIKSVLAGFILVSILFLVLFMPIAQQANAISKGTVPTFDKVWYGSMYKIQNESQSNAIITSWWDFGHFFTAISHRGTTFDGASQTVPQAHWVGKLLMENDPEISHDILQMLVCGGNMAHETMLGYTSGTTADAVKVNKIIYSTFGKKQVQKEEILRTNKYYKYDETQVENIMKYLACTNPPENFVITSEDMIGKAGVWAHWGSWDFTKKYVYDNYQLKTVEQIAIDIDENTTLIQKYVDELKAIDKKAVSEDIKRQDLINQWLAPYPSYIPIQNQYEYPCQAENSTLVCQNGINIDMKTGKVSSNFNAEIKFANLVYPSQDNTTKVVRQNKEGDVDVVLIPSGSGGFNIMLAQYPLGNSLFTKLYYLHGAGLEDKFTLFDSQSSYTGVSYTIWKVNWDDVNSSSSNKK